MKVSKFTEGLGLTEDGIQIFEDTASNEQRPATTRQGIMDMLACCEEILKEKKRYLSRQTNVIPSSHLQGLAHRYLYCWTLEI